MRNPDQVLGQIRTRGDFRALSELEHSDRSDAERARVPHDHLAWEVWDAIRSAWPGQTINWPDEPQMAWAYAVDGISAEIVGEGIRTMVRSGDTFPPSAPEFRRLCLQIDTWEHERIQHADRLAQERLALPPPPRDPQVIASGIASLREALVS
ncbi:MAG: hypothetical protein AAFY29_22865 [Pseudomonadota bacterium]